MITAHFHKLHGGFTQVSLSGHAQYAALGTDIVCSAVTSAVQLTANTLTQVFLVDAAVCVGNNTIVIKLPANASAEATKLLKALHQHLSVLSADYPNNVSVTTMEVS